MAKKNEAILDGTSLVNRMANEKRALAVRPRGSFRESAFHYLGETALVWSTREFMRVPKWRDDALRRSRKNMEWMEREDKVVGGRSKRSTEISKESRRVRYRRIMDGLYEKSLQDSKVTRPERKHEYTNQDGPSESKDLSSEDEKSGYADDLNGNISSGGGGGGLKNEVCRTDCRVRDSASGSKPDGSQTDSEREQDSNCTKRMKKTFREVEL